MKRIGLLTSGGDAPGLWRRGYERKGEKYVQMEKAEAVDLFDCGACGDWRWGSVVDRSAE